MAQENENRLHAFIAFGTNPGTDAFVLTSGGVDLESIVLAANGSLTLRLVEGIADGALFTAIGTGEDAGGGSPAAPPGVYRVAGDPEERTFRIVFGEADQIAGSVSWWSVPLQPAPILIPVTP